MEHSKVVDSVSGSFRAKRFQRFLELFRIEKHHSILDVGGSPYFWTNSGFESNVTIVNIDLPKYQPAPFTWCVGNACSMPQFADQSFDIVFSNSVIEHVGNYDSQKQMADEIQRIGKRYWVQTPYKHFPIEPHFVFPFFQYLPIALRRGVAYAWPFSFAKRQGRDPLLDARSIWLLDVGQVKALFPKAMLERERLMGLTKSLVAYQT